MTTASGVELLVYLKDMTPLAYIPRFSDLSALDEMGGPGSGIFRVRTDDQVLTDYPHILDYRNVVKVLVNGVVTAAMVIQTKKTVLVESNGGTTSYVEVSGEGLRTWFNDAELYPEKGIFAYSYDTRSFNAASGNEAMWKNGPQWKPPVVADNYSPTTPVSLAHVWAGNPANWPPQGINAKWIWNSGYSPTTPVGTIWARRTFTTTVETTFQLYMTVDNNYEAYIDGQLVLTSGGTWRQTDTVTFTIPAGSHVLGIKAYNKEQWAGILVQMSAINSNGLPSGDFLHSGDGNAGWTVTNSTNMTPMGWTPGAVLSQLLNEAQTRGVLFPTKLTQNFSYAMDSHGQAWQNTDYLDWSFNVGDNYTAVVQQIEAVGYEVWIDPAAMTINIALHRGADHSISQGTSDAVVLAAGKNLQQADSSGQATMVNVLLTKSSDGWVETKDPNDLHIQSYGRLEGSISVTADGTTAAKISSSTINQSGNTQLGSTYTLVPVPGATPKVDFNVGDYVSAPDENGSQVQRRVMSITTTTDDVGNPLYACEFDTIFQEMEIRLNNAINAMTNGTLATGWSASGNSIPNNPTRINLTPFNVVTADASPAAPTNLACAMVLTYNSVGTPTVQATISWTAVTLSVFGFDCLVSDYQVWGINQSAAQPVPYLMATPGGGSTSATITDLAYGATWQFYVIARTNPSLTSPPSATLSQTLNPVVPPLTVPTAPTVSSKLGMVQITWDGNLATTPNPTTPPVQFDHLTVQMSSTQTGTYVNVGQNLKVAGQIVIPNLTVGGTYWFKLMAVDKLGNPSALTAPVSVVVVGVATPDLDATVQNAITNAQNTATAAQTAANGKNTIYYGGTAPTGTSFNVNDVWFNSAAGNEISYWNGTAWTASQLGSSAIANNAITASQLATAVNNSISSAQTAATAAQTATAQRGAVIYAPTAPTGLQQGSSNLWINTSGGANTPNIFTGNGTPNGSASSISDLVAGVVRTNLCLNPNFETNTTNWVAEAGAILTRDTTSPISGTASAKLTNGGDTYTRFNVNAGDVITVSVSYQTVGTITGAPRIYLQTPGTNSVSVYLPLTQTSPGTFSITSTATTTGSAIFAVFAGAALTDVVHFDNVLAEKSSTPGIYFDGNSIGAWWGTGSWATATDIVATNAASAASAAQSTANSAQTSANGKNTITYSAAAATGSGTVSGDLWFQTSSGVVIGQWQWNGTAWVSQTIGSAVIASLDAGKITTGTLSASVIGANTITGAMIAANTITAADIAANTITASQIAANTITAAQIAASTITTNEIAANTITAADIAANTITAAQMATGTITAASGIIANAAIGTAQIANAAVTNAQIGNVDAGKITTGFLAAARIAANTITSSMILVGDFTNIATGSDFEGVSAAQPWTLGAAWSVDTTQHHSGTKSLKCTGTLTGVATLGTTMGVQGADQYYVEFWVYRDATWNGTATNSRLKFVDQASTVAASFNFDATSIPATTWTKVSGTLTVPAASTSLTVTLNTDATAGNAWIDDVIIRLKNTGNLIVDGTITGTKLAANTITASQIAAGAITANSLAAGAIDGFTITGALLQTSATAARGVKLDSTGLKAYNSSGTALVTIDATTGALTATSATVTGTINASAGTFSGSISVTGTMTGGTYQTAASGQRFVISGTTITAHSVNDATATITATDSTNGGILRSSLILDTGNNGSVTIGGNLVAGNNGTLNTDTMMLSKALYNSESSGTSLMAGWAIAAGQGSNVASSYTTVTFPTGRFSQPPLCFGTTRGASVAIMNIGTVTSTSAQISGFNAASSAIASSWNWIAIQMTQASSIG